MTVISVDYTAFYYRNVAKIPLPPHVAGKFIQVFHETTLFLVFSPAEFTKYHANIAERFCMGRGIEGSYDPERKKFTIADRSWEIRGGGKFERDDNDRVIRLYDNSLAYGKFRSEGLKELLAALPEFSGYTILIE